LEVWNGLPVKGNHDEFQGPEQKVGGKEESHAEAKGVGVVYRKETVRS